MDPGGRPLVFITAGSKTRSKGFITSYEFVGPDAVPGVDAPIAAPGAAESDVAPDVAPDVVI